MRIRHRWKLQEAKWDTEEVEKRIPTRLEGRVLNRLEKSLQKSMHQAAKNFVGVVLVGKNIYMFL